jgi:NAD(P)-dependent dehydrogenase (short-subunit alcohol dehydrogenase family)
MNNRQDIYFRNALFSPMIPIAGIYSIVAHFALMLLKPFPKFRVNEALLLPQDQFEVSINDKHVAIVTGSNTGIGFQTASALVEKGYEVIIACRSRDKGVIAANNINISKRNGCKGKAIFLHPLDLASLDSVNAFAKDFQRKYSTLHILVNNAGINTSGTSVDNMDLCFQTNFLGHYLLTRKLIPNLLRAENRFPADHIVERGRVVNLSSVTHHFSSCHEKRHGAKCDNISGKHDESWWKCSTYPGVSDNTYKESKLAALLFTHELNKQYGGLGLRAISCNPGSVNSDIWRNYPKFMELVHKALYLTPKQGCITSIVAALGKLPPKAVYLQPYWQPFSSTSADLLVNPSLSFSNWFTVKYPFSEMLGPYVGYAITDPRLPTDVDASSAALWRSCGELVHI